MYISNNVELSMRSAVYELVTAASWKLKVLVRTTRFYTDADLVFIVQSALAFIFGVLDTRNLPRHARFAETIGSDSKQTLGRGWSG